MSEPVNYTAHIQFLASAAASVDTPEEFRELIQDLTTADSGIERAGDVLQAGLINPAAALQLGLSAGGSSTLGDGPIGGLLQSNDPQLWASLHQAFSNEAVVTALQNPQLQQALTTALSTSDTSALSALGLDAEAQAAVTNIASANVLNVIGSAQAISLVPPTPPATEPTVNVVTADGSTVALNTLVEQQGFQAVLQQQLGAEHPVVTRLAQDPAMASTLLGHLNAGGENGPLAGLNLGAAGDAAVAAHVGPRVMEALQSAQTITINGSGADATITLHNADGTQTNLNDLMLRQGVTAVLQQTPTAESPAFLHALHGDAEFRASFERLIEAEPTALQSMMGFMENGIGLENSSGMQDMLRNPAFREKLTEIMDEVATRDDVSFEQVAGVLQSAAAGNYLEAFGRYRELGLETNLLTGEFMTAAAVGGAGMAFNSMLGPLAGPLGDLLGPIGEFLGDMIIGLIEVVGEAMGFDTSGLTSGLRNAFGGATPFETEVRGVDVAATTSARPTAEFSAAANRAVEAAGPEASPLTTFEGVSNIIFEAEVELGDELRGLAGTPDLRDRFMSHLTGLGSDADRMAAIAEWREDLASGMTTRAATMAMGR